MIFLIEYDRSEGRIVDLKRFVDSERTQADDTQRQAELELSRIGADREVVILEAASEDALRKTHRRYFDDARTIAGPASGSRP